MYTLITFVSIIYMLIIGSAPFDIRCPYPSQWKLREHVVCPNTSAKFYYCLYDNNNNQFTELCRPLQTTAARGYKIAYSGGFDFKKCSDSHFQPFGFTTDGNSDCVYLKMLCQDEGLVAVGNRESTTDNNCACDYKRGYGFVIMPVHKCDCIPSQDDCSCYKHICNESSVLLPDYTCTKSNKLHNKQMCSDFATGSTEQMVINTCQITIKNEDIKIKYNVTASIAVLVLIILICLGTPTFTVEREMYRSSPRNEIEMKSIIDSVLPVTFIAWRRTCRNNQPSYLTPDKDIVIQGYNSLMLRNVQKGDSGMYTCVVSIFRVKYEFSTEVVIEDTPCLVISEPSLVLNNGMEILCTVPLPGNKFQIQSVVWKIITESHKSTSIVCGPKYKVKNEIEQNSSSLLVKNLDVNDVGKYQCCISNNTEERICSIVVESPRITDVSKKLHVSPSNRMSLEYFFKSTLPVSKRLQKKHETVEIDILPTQESRNSLCYTIESACIDDAGTYTCTVSNVFGESRISTILTVGDRPVITAGCLSYTVPEGQDTIIKCEVQSTLPITKLFWQKNDEDHISSETRPDKYKNASTPYLTIVKVTPSDQGSYICYASNQVGTAQSFTIELKVDQKMVLNTSFVSRPFYTGKEGTFAQVALEKIDAEAARKRCRHLIDEELRIVVIGKTGAGKSATCNTIIGKKKFQSELSAKGITKTTESERVEVCGKKILLIDTPGILDIEANEKDIEREIQKCVVIGAPGIHAILFVMPIGDRTEENIRVIHTFLDYFGKEELIKHVIVVFTFGDRLKEDETTIENYLKNAPKDTLDFLQKCGNRYVVFNNKIKSYKKIEQVRGLINLISRHKYEKDLCYYTDQYFEAAEKELREKEDEIQRKLEEMYLRRIEDFNNSFKSIWESFEACVLGSIEGDLETYKKQLKEHETKNKKEIDELKAKYEERLSRVRDEARSELKDKPTCVVLRKK